MKSILADLKAGSFKPVYLLFGDERYLVRQYRDKLVHALVSDDDTMNYARFSGKNTDIREVIDLCETLPFLAERRVILLEDTGFFKNKCDELADYLKELPDYLVLLFTEEQVDKRSRTYKAAAAVGRAVEFKTQDEKTLADWINRKLWEGGLRITQKNASLLIEKTGTDMVNLRTEIDKLISYCYGKTAVTAEDIEAVCTTRIENRIFDMIRAVTERNAPKAISLYRDLLTLKEPSMKILVLLGRQFRQLYLIKEMEEEGISAQEISSRLGLQSFAVSRLSKCARAYSIRQLKEAVAAFTEADEAVKTGRLTDQLSVELMLIRFSTPDKEKAAT